MSNYLSNPLYHKPKLRGKRAQIAARLQSSRRQPKVSTSQETPVSTSRSAQKISAHLRIQDESSLSTELQKPPKYFYADPQQLQKLFDILLCPKCSGTELRLSAGAEYEGFSTILTLDCYSCAENICKLYSSKRIEDPNTTRGPFHINKKMVETFIQIGLGHAGMERMCIALNMNVMSRVSFSTHLDAISKEVSTFSKEVLSRARRIVRDNYLVVSEEEEQDGGIIDLVVSYDGSWQRRGFSSIYGISFVIDVLSGMVIDYMILCKLCVECEKAKTELGEDSAEYDIWYEGHKNFCEKNYSGSSPAMERAAAQMLWERSIEECQMRYTTVIADGDTKTVSWLNSNKVYGDEIKIEKMECVNHIEKRMGTALRKAVGISRAADNERKRQEEGKEPRKDKVKKKKSDQRSESLYLGGGKDGNLSEAKIMKLQSYYRNAIVDNVPHVHLMQQAVMATLEHYVSTDENPCHQLCPQGPSSWCWYNKALAESLDSEEESEAPSHNDHPPLLNSKVIEAIRPVYERLSHPDLMSKCIHGGTSNANEALHHCVWNKCPKEKFQSRKKLEIAVAFAVSEFNMGCESTARLRSEMVGESVGSPTRKISQDRDAARMRQSQSVSEAGARYHRKAQKRVRKTEERKKKDKEGTTYAPGMAGLDDEEREEPETKKKAGRGHRVSEPKKTL